MMDGIAGIDSTGAELNNTVVDFKRQKTMLRRRTKRSRQQTISSSSSSANIWDPSESEYTEEEVDWQEIIDNQESME